MPPTEMSFNYNYILLPGLFALSFAGLAYAILKTILSGAEEYSGAYTDDMSKQFEDVFLFIPAKRLREISWISAGAAFLLGFLLLGSFTSGIGMAVGLVFGIVFGLLALFSPRWFLALLKSRRLLKFNLQLVDTLVSMSNSLKAGFSITQAFEQVVKDGEVPIAQEFDLFLHQTRVGVNFSDALTNLEERVGSEDMTLVVTAIETARKTGGNLTEIFEKIATTIRERMRIENRIRTLTAQGRMQGIIVGAMPALIGIAMFILDPGMMMPFLQSAVGISVIAAVFILILCGGLLIKKIVNIDV